MAPKTPDNEAARLQELSDYEILDTPPEEGFDRITRLASMIMGAPVSLISLVDQDRQWFKATVGWDAKEIPREQAFCAHTIQGDEIMEVTDATRDPRFRDNPLVTDQPYIRFYAGAPLVTRSGYNIGSMCVIDQQPGSLSDAQRTALHDLSQLVTDQIDLRLAGREVSDRLKRSRALHEAKDEFVSSVTHELRTPLTSMRGALSVLQSSGTEEFSDRAQHLLDMAQRNTDRLLNHVDDLLDIQRIQSGRFELECQTQDVSALLRETIESMQGYAHAANVGLIYSSRSEAEAYVDPKRLKQIIENLVSNACKFSASGSEVRVALTSTRDNLTISVSDQGSGIPEDIRPRLYEWFSKAQEAKNTSGSGIGLWLVRRLTQAHGGHVTFETEQGKGTTFFVTLPRNQEDG